MSTYVDILITDNDITLDAAGEPVLVYDADCIAQDIKHMVRESGLLFEMIGQRDSVAIAANLQSLVLLVEDDVRIVPGSVEATQSTTELVYITATTYDFGDINAEVSV